MKIYFGSNKVGDFTEEQHKVLIQALGAEYRDDGKYAVDQVNKKPDSMKTLRVARLRAKRDMYDKLLELEK